MPFLHKKPSFLQIGLHRRDNRLQLLWFDGQDRPHTLTEFADEPDLKTRFAQALQQSYRDHRSHLRFIASIAAHLTWSKTLILPQHLSEQECWQQCRFVLEKELPIPLNELWFDFRSTPLTQGFRLDVSAIRKTSAEEYLQRFQPFRLDVLDLAPNSVLRAFRYLIGEKVRSENTLFLFEDENGCLALSERSQQSRVLQSSENLTALFAQFQQRFPEPIEQVFVYQSPHCRTDLPADWQPVETDLPFLALGNALWGREWVQTKNADEAGV